MDVEPGLATFAGLRVHLLLDLVAHFLDLEPFLSEQKRIRDVFGLSLDEFSEELVIEVVVVEDLNVVLLVVVVLVAAAGRLMTQDIVSRPKNPYKYSVSIFRYGKEKSQQLFLSRFYSVI